MPEININSIETNTVVFVTGTVDYSHIKTHVEGDELIKSNARKVARGMQPIDKAHTFMTIARPTVNFENPAAPTLAEQYIATKFYTSDAHPEKGQLYTGMNRTRNLPELYCRENANSNNLEHIACENEIAAGENVTLLLRFFSTERNKGVSLDGVIVNEKPVKWFSGTSALSSLSKRGFNITDTNDSAVREQLENNMATQPTVPIQPAVAPAAYVQPPQAAYAQPPQAAYAQPAPTVPTVPTVPTQPAPMPVPPPVSAAPSLPVPPKGYMYDANNRIVPIPQGGITL